MKKKDFPIVGIGASAGGLEAYKTLLRTLPADSGAAFILVQHLDPNHESMMADLLDRQTGMTVLQAENEMKLAPDTVYVIPPGKFIRIVDHALVLDEPVKERGVRLSIDHFFRSLAETRGEKSIAIVLSGTGSDGTLGIREVKAAGGMVMVQKPEDAEYDGMPRSAIATGAVDFVVPVEDMADRLVRFLRHPYLRKAEPAAGLSEAAPDGFNDVLRMLRDQTAYDFRSYKKGTVERRIQRRMGLRQIKDLGDYVEHMRQSPEEVHLLFRDLLIGVTRFFREPEAWEALGAKVIDPLIARKPKGSTIRAWVPGCASGEEAYTLAMMLYDRVDRQNDRVSVQIFGTDLNDRAIETARTGRYASAIAGDLPKDMLKRFFIEEDDTLRVNKRLRESVVFATQNVISDPPFSKLDLITCRNLMIYLEADVQRRMIEMFHFALADAGHLFLGNSENAERPGRLFVPVDKTNRIYRRSDVARIRSGSFPIVPGGRRRSSQQGDADPAGFTSSSDRARRQLMERFVPAALLVDRTFEVQYFHGPVRNYLDFPTGEPTSQLPDIALPAIRTKLRAILNAVISGKGSAEAVAARVPRNGHHVSVRITAEAISDPDGDGRILVHFTDVSEPRDTEADQKVRDEARAKASPEEQDQVASLEYELQSTREDLQSTIEEMETANEELKASNEEVMSMNEELQSTNEELETSREELQSLNEELSTVNSQLEDKVEEVERTNNDLTNLLVSTDIGVIFLDTNLLIRRYTPAMREIMRIIDGDIGRPVEDIAMRARDPALIADAKRCLERLVEVEAEIATEDSRHLIRRMRPYRTSENRIEGVVVTYTDVSTLQNAKAAAKRREQQQQAVAELGRTALSDSSIDDVFEMAVTAVASHLGARFAKILQLDDDRRTFVMRSGVGWHDGLVGTARVENGVKSQAGYTLERSSPVVVRDFRDEKRFTAPSLLKDHHILCGASVIVGPVEAPWGVLGAHESDLDRCRFDADDINFMQSVAHVLWLAISRERAVAEIERERAQLRNMTDALPIRFAVLDAKGRYEFVNRAYHAWGHTPEQVEGAHKSTVVGREYYAQVEPHVRAVLEGTVQSFEVTFPDPEGDTGGHTDLVSYVPRWDADGTVSGFYSASLDITRQKRLERDLAERFNQYSTLGESIAFGVWITDADGNLTYVSPSFLDLVGMTFEDARDLGWIRALEPGSREETERLWQVARETGANWQKEHRIVGADGAMHHVLSLGRPIRDDDGTISSWVGLNLDITDRKEEEVRLGVVSAELDHRVKNVLATVTTIARMTGRTATSVEAYSAALEARIQAMAAAHKLLAEANWRGMNIRVLIETELAPYLHTHGKVEITGPDFMIEPSLIQPFVLALHELTTNSAKYGALNADGGHLAISWSANGVFELSWNETGLTGVVQPINSGFGTTLLTRILAAQEIDVDLEYRQTGLVARMKMTIG